MNDTEAPSAMAFALRKADTERCAAALAGRGLISNGQYVSLCAGMPLSDERKAYKPAFIILPDNMADQDKFAVIIPWHKDGLEIPAGLPISVEAIEWVKQKPPYGTTFRTGDSWIVCVELQPETKEILPEARPAPAKAEPPKELPPEAEQTKPETTAAPAPGPKKGPKKGPAAGPGPAKDKSNTQPPPPAQDIPFGGDENPDPPC